MPELTEQEQLDLDKATAEGLDLKFTDQLVDMGNDHRDKLETVEKSYTYLLSDVGKANYIDINKDSYVGKEIVNLDWEEDPENPGHFEAKLNDDGVQEEVIIPAATEEESAAMVEAAYQIELTYKKKKVDDVTESIRLIEIELNARQKGWVERNPIGTTYFLDSRGSNSNPSGSTGISPSNTIRNLYNFTDNTRSAGDVLVCRRTRGGFNPGELGYKNSANSITASGTAITDTIDGNSSTIKWPRKVANIFSDHGQTAGTNNNCLENWHRVSDPRDRSTYAWHYSQNFTMKQSTSEAIDITSDGTAENPIIVMADYENAWGDFIDCRVGANGDDGLNGSTAANKGGYRVTFGSKIIKRTSDGTASGTVEPVHSYITPGDWIVVSELDGSSKPSVSPGVGDDPYEFAYMVRDVNYDKIVLWHPYKGTMAGDKRPIISMGYNPRYGSMYDNGHDEGHTSNQCYFGNFSDDRHWIWQGIDWYWNLNHTTGQHPESRKLMKFSGSCVMSFKDCMFHGHNRYQSNYYQYNQCAQLWDIRGGYNHLQADKCIFTNSNNAIWLNDAGYYQQSTVILNDCILNGYDSSRVTNSMSWSSNDNYIGYHKRGHHKPEIAIGEKWSAGTILRANEVEFVNWSIGHIVTYSNDLDWTFKNCRFYGHGMDFVDFTTDTIADAHENLGVRWARPAFATTPLANAGSGTATDRKISTSTGKWTGNTYGPKWYWYVGTDIPDGAGGYGTGIDERSFDRQTVYDSGSTDARSDNNGSYRRFGGIGTGHHAHWYANIAIGSNHLTDWNRYDGSTHRYKYTNYMGAGALIGAKNFVSTNGEPVYEDGTEKWNNWWYVNTADETFGSDYKKGLPYMDEIGFDWQWFMRYYHSGGYNLWSNAYEGGDQSESNTDENRDDYSMYGWGANSGRNGLHAPFTNISINASNSYGAEEGLGPGGGIGFSPTYGTWYSYHPYRTTHDAYGRGKGVEQINAAIQDCFEMYANYDKSYHTTERHPEMFDPPIQGGIGTSKVFWTSGQKDMTGGSQTWNDQSEWFQTALGAPTRQLMETVTEEHDGTAILRSGGGSYVIKVYVPSWGLAQTKRPENTGKNLASGDVSKEYMRWYKPTQMQLFEYPFYLSTNARTYTVYLRRCVQSGTDHTWTNDPTQYECYLEMDYLGTKDADNIYLKPGYRRTTRSTTGLTFSSGAGGWESLSVTVTPETEGVGYLRLWWAKPLEANKANCFYVDPKVEVT